MTAISIDFKLIPPALHRIVRSWYSWREIAEHRQGQDVRVLPHDPLRWEYWRNYLPQMCASDEFRIGDGDFCSYLVSEDGVFYIDTGQRGSRSRDCMFARFEDAEKYLLFRIADEARSVNNIDSLDLRWYRQGIHPRVKLTNLDPEKEYPIRFSLTVDQELVDRGWMREMDAVSFSHAIVLTYEELDAKLREDVPPEWFTLELIGA